MGIYMNKTFQVVVNLFSTFAGINDELLLDSVSSQSDMLLEVKLDEQLWQGELAASAWVVVSPCPASPLRGVQS